jgi:hypothetical protein
VDDSWLLGYFSPQIRRSQGYDFVRALRPASPGGPARRCAGGAAEMVGTAAAWWWWELAITTKDLILAE